MKKLPWIKALSALGLTLLSQLSIADATPFKIGFITPMTGPFASTGAQMLAGAKLYMAQHLSLIHI